MIVRHSIGREIVGNCGENIFAGSSFMGSILVGATARLRLTSLDSSLCHKRDEIDLSKI